jgi:uncharacterized protein (DUF58 family)
MKSFDPDFLKKLERLALQGGKLVQGGTGGNRRSKSKGSAIEFSDFREYTLGDDFRSIDWNAYARFERLFVKLYMEEREANITIFVDASASMDQGEPNKGMLAKQLAAVFAYIALANYDRVGIAAVNDAVIGDLPYFSGKPGFSKALGFLDELGFRGNTGLKKAVESYSPLRGKRGISILISDFLSGDGYLEALQYLKYQQQDVVVIHILSPQELDPQLAGALRLIDVETGQPVEVEVTPHTLGVYKKALHAYLEELKTTCRNMEISYLLASSDVSLDRIVFDLLQQAGIIR